jgi:hypothetical protein
MTMGTNTSLSALNFNSTEDNSGQIYGDDIIGMLNVAQTNAGELIYQLNLIASRLPNGDPNITTIQTLITNLS